MNHATDNSARLPGPRRVLVLASLILAGESIYMLPYLRKSFQTSMEATFGLDSLQVGALNALFGALALLSYLPGGWLADRVSARRLLTVSLLATAAGGLYMATRPGYSGLLLVHALWGVFSILTFWAALIKATRLFATPATQGRAFGILDGGRGLVGAMLGSLAAIAFGLSASAAAGLTLVILIYTGACLFAALAVWTLVPDDHARAGTAAHEHRTVPGAWDEITATLQIRAVWWIAVLIFSAYFCFLGTYEFPAFAERGYDRSKQFGAWLGAYRDWMRPAAAVVAGILADRYSASRTTGVAFGVLTLAFGTLAARTPGSGQVALAILFAQVTGAGLAVFALRGVYYALFEEARIPLARTGIAVGLVSMAGYTPDIIAPLLAGWLADQFSGATGYRIYFAGLSLLSAAGIAASIRIRRLAQHNQAVPV